MAVNAQNDIIVADTNNHRIQIFDKEGRFKFQFGECGKLAGQLLYPNRVAVVKNTGKLMFFGGQINCQEFVLFLLCNLLEIGKLSYENQPRKRKEDKNIGRRRVLPTIRLMT